MTEALNQAKQGVAPKWLELADSVRHHAKAAMDGNVTDESAKSFASEAVALCDHVDQLHGDLEKLRIALEGRDSSTKSRQPNEKEVDMAAIEVQRETHEMRADPLDILKALLMWRDDPAERVK